MQQISKNIFWLTFSRIIALVLLFVAYTQLFRYLGPFGSGQYQFVLSYVTIFSTMVDFGVMQFITKKIAEDGQNTKKYFFNFLNFQIFASLLLFGLLLLVAYFKNFETIVFEAIAVTGLGMVVNSMTFPFLAVLTVRQDMKKVAFINFLNSLVNIFIIFLVIHLKKYIIFLSTIQLSFGLMDLYLYRRFLKIYAPDIKIRNIFSNIEISSVFNILKTSWPYALIVGFSAIYNRIDVVLITKFLGFAQTGLYTAAYKFFDLLNFFPAAVSHVLFPVFVGLMAKKKFSEVKVNLEKYLRIMFMVALPVAAGGSLLAKQLIDLIAGSEYSLASTPLAVIFWAVAVLIIYIPLNSLMLSQLTKIAMWILGFNVLLNVLGNVILLPKIGILGAAIMTVVSELLQGFMYGFFVKKKITKFSFFKNFLKPAFATLVMIGCIFPFRDQNLFILFFVGALIYFGTLFFIRFFTQDEIIIVRNIFKKYAIK